MMVFIRPRAFRTLSPFVSLVALITWRVLLFCAKHLFVAASVAVRHVIGFYSAIRREVAILTFNDWKSSPSGFCEVATWSPMAVHGGGLVHPDADDDRCRHGLDRVPLVTRDGSLVVEAMKHVQSLFPWLLRGVDFDDDRS